MGCGPRARLVLRYTFYATESASIWALRLGWQTAASLHDALRLGWQAAANLHDALRLGWQTAANLHDALRLGWQTAANLHDVLRPDCGWGGKQQPTSTTRRVP